MEKNHVAKLNIFGKNWSKCHFGNPKPEKGPSGDNFKKPYLRNYLEHRNKILHGPMNSVKVCMRKISSKSII